MIAYWSCFAAVWVLLGPKAWSHPGLMAAALALQLAAGVAFVVRDRWDDRQAAGIGLLVVFLTSVALLRAAVGPQAGVYGLLLLLTVVWAASRSRRGEMAVGLAALAAFVALAVDRGERYPAMTWSSGALLVVVATILGVGVLQLVDRLRASERRAAGHQRERAQLVDLLAQQVRTDSLTGLLNRRGWDELAPRELAHAARHGEPVTIALLDLDHFKAFNDAHGHQAGDDLLREIGVVWTRAMRSTDLLCRWGGEEFAVLLADCGLPQAHQLVERLRQSLPAGQTCSAGLALADGSAAIDELVSCADVALYRAKRAGRDQIVAAA